MDNYTSELEKLDNIMIKYISALKILETQIEIINDDFKYIKKYNPIEHVKTRIKTADSIINKLIDLNDSEKDSIKYYNQGEALFVCGNRRMRINIIATQEELDSFGAGGGL